MKLNELMITNTAYNFCVLNKNFLFFVWLKNCDVNRTIITCNN